MEKKEKTHIFAKIGEHHNRNAVRYAWGMVVIGTAGTIYTWTKFALVARAYDREHGLGD